MTLRSDYKAALMAYKRAEREGDENTMRARAHDMARIAECMEGEE